MSIISLVKGSQQQYSCPNCNCSAIEERVPILWRAQKITAQSALSNAVRRNSNACSASSLSTPCPPSPEKVHVAYVLDIEGTTTPLPFVTNVLYPASREYLPTFLEHQYPNNAIVKRCCEDAAAQFPPLRQALSSNDDEVVRKIFATHLQELIEKNSKVTYLKVLQGLIWKGLYEDGSIKGDLFRDAATVIQRVWASKKAVPTTGTSDAATATVADQQAQQTRLDYIPSSSSPFAAISHHFRDPIKQDTSVWIYSSGSIAAQQLLFRHSSYGDMTPFISGYFDPATVGPKFDASSYRNIKSSIESQLSFAPTAPLVVAFLTDSIDEVIAARASGVVDLSVFLTRPMNIVLSDDQLEKAFGEKALQKSTNGPRPAMLNAVVSSFEQLVGDDVLEDDDTAVRKKWRELMQQVSRYQASPLHKQRSFL